ncbi:aminoglycoside phosphotransferase family protein [Nitrospinota bacterium]
MMGQVRSEAAESLKRLAEGRFGVRVTGISPLAGDASDRAYVRIHHPGISPPASVGMILPSGFSDEDLPYLNVQSHFREIGLPVPEVYASDPGAGAVLLEDGGDQSLEDILNFGGWEAARPYYEESIELIVRLQKSAGTSGEPAGRLALSYGFDAALFERELHMTRRCAFGDLLGMPATEADFASPFAALAGELCALPFVLAHRDFHSRNLMAGDTGRLLVLDFQDARLGPLTYDLGSLVFDSYASLPEEGRDVLIGKFWEKSGARDHFSGRTAFDHALALTGLQRNLKAIGTFSYQKTKRGNSRYIRHIPLTAAHVRHHLSRLSGWKDFAARLEPYLCALEDMKMEAGH